MIANLSFIFVRSDIVCVVGGDVVRGDGDRDDWGKYNLSGMDDNYYGGTLFQHTHTYIPTDEQLRRRCQLKALHSLFNLHMDLRCLLADIIRMELLLLRQ